MSKKICIIGPAYPLRGGLATFNERLAKAYMSLGHQVKMYTFSVQYPSIFFPGKTQLSEDKAPKDLDIEVCINSVNPLNWIPTGKKIAKQNFDLVICRFWIPFMGPSLGTILRQITDRSSTKVVGLIDNIVPHEKRIGDTTLARYFTKACDAFIVMSKSVGQELQHFITDQKVGFAAHPIYDVYQEAIPDQAAKQALSLDTDQSYLLFFGFIRAYKGLDLLIEAMANEMVKELGVKLIIAGEYYEDQEKYESKIRAYGLSENIILHTKYISNEEVHLYFCASDLIVQPYHTATQSGISQIAYHFEKPMLVTNVGGLPEIVDHQKNGYVVPVNAEDIARSIHDFYQHDRMDTFVQGVKVKKKQFSWANFMDAIDKL
jgi:glycosyltransferase involved in cell wall biosynthesis